MSPPVRHFLSNYFDLLFYCWCYFIQRIFKTKFYVTFQVWTPSLSPQRPRALAQALAPGTPPLRHAAAQWHIFAHKVLCDIATDHPQTTRLPTHRWVACTWSLRSRRAAVWEFHICCDRTTLWTTVNEWNRRRTPRCTHSCLLSTCPQDCPQINNNNSPFTWHNLDKPAPERESRFLTAHQHKNRPLSAIRGKNSSKWDNHVN